MDKKICLICQPCGLGDILFMQKIAKTYYDAGFEIWWPIVHEFEFLSDYITWINWVSWNDKINKLTGPPFGDDVEFPYKDYYDYNQPHIFGENFVYINGFYPPPTNKNMMIFKYEMCGIDYSDWSDYLSFNRNYEKENTLYNAFGLQENEEYVLVNRLFQTRPNITVVPFISNDPKYYNMNVIEWTIVDGFCPFDWSKIIENATKIVTIDTSILYIIETLKNKKSNQYDMFLRSGKDTYELINKFFKTPWNYKL